ncbi:hypothetical protein KKF81_04985 [Candidatus Micrarchaeota archaeon]|nr:hypothetical protein [Candidatus Micrarchaeota archaeon]MBU1166281.1 hypothetical protein [Candidatus Micrarchaeota archaeon]MBU1886726.1 hypothetical protein [Candidatus Micrarchaeota archaeon]
MAFKAQISAICIVSLLFLLNCSFAVNIISPVNQDVKNGDIIDLGAIGPGQTVSFLIDPIVTSGGVHDIGGTYDTAQATGLPVGWSSEKSKLYQNPMQVTITAAPAAPEGMYYANITIMDEYDGEQLGNVTFIAKVRITWDVLEVDVSPDYYEVGPGQPARFSITVTNKGSASDVFQISSVGAKKWEFQKPVFVPAKSSKVIYYEIAGYEEEVYTPKIKVVSLASDIISSEKNVTIAVRSGLFGDYRATNNGAVVFPIFELIIYSFAGIISNLINLVTV